MLNLLKFKELLKAVFFFSVFVTIASCTHKNDNTSDAPITSDTACDPNTVYFVNDVQPVINSNCAYAGCHDVVSHKEGVDLSSYDKIISTGGVKAGNPNGSELYEKISEGEMPPSGPLAAAQQQLIYDWIKQGAKNNKCVSACDTSNVKFSTTVKPIIDNNCMGCHSGSSPAGGIALTNYSQIKTVAANGRLLGSIEHAPGYSPMPKNMAMLSSCKIAQIKIWINEGMQNN